MREEEPQPDVVTEADLADIGNAIDRSTMSVQTPFPVADIVDLALLRSLPVDAPIEEVERALVALRESLAADVDALTLATLRQTLRRDFPWLPAPMLDAALAPKLKPRAAETANDKRPPAAGSEVQLREDEPWPNTVALDSLLHETAAAVRRYVVVSPHQATAIALWIGMSYAIDALSIAPILLITSATMRAGKTTLCLVLGALTPRPALLSSLTPAVVFRLIEKHHPTLIADEADSWLHDEKSELRGIICAGHTRAAAWIPRCVGDDNDVRLFSAWCARAISMIGQPPATIRDRSIPIELRRRKSDEGTIERLRTDRIERDLESVRRQWRRWALDNLDSLREADPTVPDALGDRAADCWRPLLAIADFAGPTWSAVARQAAISLCSTEADESSGLDLLSDVRGLFDKDDAEWLESSLLTSALNAMADRPWPEFQRGRPLTPHSLARLLKSFGILPVQRRSGATVHRGYAKSAFADAWSRYLQSDRYIATAGETNDQHLPPENWPEAL